MTTREEQAALEHWVKKDKKTDPNIIGLQFLNDSPDAIRRRAWKAGLEFYLSNQAQDPKI